jgi:hypothetical protein
MLDKTKKTLSNFGNKNVTLGHDTRGLALSLQQAPFPLLL